MRRDMRQRRTVCDGERVKCAELIQDVGADLVG